MIIYRFQQAKPFFPTAKEPDTACMDVLLEGELVLEDGCLRVKNDKGGSNHLIL